MEQAWELDRKRLGAEADPSSRWPVMLAGSYVEAGQFAKAEPLYRAAVEAARDNAKKAPGWFPHLLDSLSDTLLKQQKYAEADPLLRESLGKREVWRPDEWRRFHTQSMLGGSLLGQKKYDEAEPLLLAGYEGMRERESKMPPYSKVHLADAVEWLVQLHDERGDKVMADEWRKKLAEMKRPHRESTDSP
jgi:hypothetical protein